MIQVPSTEHLVACDRDSAEDSQSINGLFKCFDGGEDSITAFFANFQHIIFVMPAKAGGTSSEAFYKKCTGRSNDPEGFLNGQNNRLAFLRNSLALPPVMASHLYNDKPLLDLLSLSSNKMLVVYQHRNEVSRLESAINFVVDWRICLSNHDKHSPKSWGIAVARNDNSEFNRTCIIDENDLLDRVIVPQTNEIGCSTPKTLSCNVFSELRKSRPKTFLIVDYKELDRLHLAAAKLHCEDLVEEISEGGFHTNVASERNIETLIKISSSVNPVTLRDWTAEKKEFLEMILPHSGVETCKRSLHSVEKQMLACSSKMLMIA
jgi:hypothetical protein